MHKNSLLYFWLESLLKDAQKNSIIFVQKVGNACTDYPKQEAKAYCVDNYVVYGAHGVCEVEKVINHKFSSDKSAQDYYVLRPIFEKESTIYVPVHSSAATECMRPVLSKSEIDEIILSAVDTEMKWSSNYKERFKQFRQILSGRNEREILQLISYLYLQSIKSRRGLTFSNTQILKAAQTIIEQEFSFSLKIPPDEVGPYIQKLLSARSNKAKII